METINNALFLIKRFIFRTFYFKMFSDISLIHRHSNNALISKKKPLTLIAFFIKCFRSIFCGCILLTDT